MTARKTPAKAKAKRRTKPASRYAIALGEVLRRERLRLGYEHPSTFGPLVGERPTNYPAYEKGLMDMSLSKLARFVWALGLENKPIKHLLDLKKSEAPIRRIAPAQEKVSEVDIRRIRELLDRNPASPIAPRLRRMLTAAESMRRASESS